MPLFRSDNLVRVTALWGISYYRRFSFHPDRDILKKKLIRGRKSDTVTNVLTEEEAEAYRKDLQETLDRLRKQEDDLKACIRHLRRQSGEESSNPDENEIRIGGLEFDIGVTQELIVKYEQDIMDLVDTRIT